MRRIPLRLGVALVCLAACGTAAEELPRTHGSTDHDEPPPDGGAGPGVVPEGGRPIAGPIFPRLPDDVFPPLAHAPGSGLALGVVTGRIYDDLVKNPDARMRDLAALGVRIVRVELERDTALADYATIAAAARAYGIEVLMLVTQASLPQPNDPMAGTRADFDAMFVPKVVAAIDGVTAAIPSLRYVEVWNEPDVYAFSPFYSFAGGACTPLEGSQRYALLTVRVFETMNERRKKGVKTPTLVAFDFSHQDDTCVLSAVADAQPVSSHRAGYRVPNGLPDGLPTDIVSIHGYGLPNKIPGELGYTYAGGSFADGVSLFLGHTFADGKRVIGAAPVWYTEVGFCLGGIGGADTASRLDRQRLAVTGAFGALRSHPEITAAFQYSYRDDEGTGGERCGLRDNSASGFAIHPAYPAFQAQAALGTDVVGPGGAFELASGAGGATTTATAKPGATVAVRGWAIDADGQAPSVSIAVDGAIVATLTDGAAPHPDGCRLAYSTRCPSVGFAASVVMPKTTGVHEIAARATDAKGNARVLGRLSVDVR